MVAPTYICFHAVTLNLNSIFGGVMCDIVTIIVGTDVLGGPPFQTVQRTQTAVLRYKRHPKVRTAGDVGPYGGDWENAVRAVLRSRYHREGSAGGASPSPTVVILSSFVPLTPPQAAYHSPLGANITLPLGGRISLTRRVNITFAKQTFSAPALRGQIQ